VNRGIGHYSETLGVVPAISDYHHYQLASNFVFNSTIHIGFNHIIGNQLNVLMSVT